IVSSLTFSQFRYVVRNRCRTSRCGASCGLCCTWLSTTCATTFGRLLSTSSTRSKFSAALRWLCSSPRATTGESPRATVIRQEHSSLLMTASSSGYLYHMQEEPIQGEEEGALSPSFSDRLGYFLLLNEILPSLCHPRQCLGDLVGG